MMKITLCFILLFTSGILFAKNQEFILKDGKIILDVPENWKKVEGFLGIELMLVGPMKSSNRPVVTVVLTNFDEFNLDQESLKKNESTYKESREKWLKKNGGSSIKYFNYETSHLKNNLQMHNLGFMYTLANKEFIERSHYIMCNKKLINIKSLTLANEEKANFKNINSIIENIICE